MERPPVDLEDLLRVPYVDPDYGFSLSPNGRSIAFASNVSGQWEIYTMPLDGSARPLRVTSGPGSKFAPRWSPGGRRLAYVLDLVGGEKFDLFVYDLAAGQHRNLTPDTADSIRPSYAWSPGGDRIAFISDRSGRFDTYVMPARGGPALLLLSVPYPDWEVRWSPDGDWLAVVVGATGQDHATYLVPLADRAPHPIGYEGSWIPAKDAFWSPDSSRLVFSSVRDEFHEIGIYDLQSGVIAWVTDGQGDKEQATWSPDGRRLGCVVSEGPRTALAVLELEGNLATEMKTYRVDAGVHYRPRFTQDGSGLVFVFDSPNRPDDLWLLSLGVRREQGDRSLASCSMQQLTQCRPPHIQDVPFLAPTEVCYAGLDGQSVPALLYYPHWVEGLPPAVLYIHGGPDWLSQMTWNPLIQHMVSRGWVVLAPNYRGSTGYGRAWQLANRFDLGGGDTRDVVAGVEYLVREGLADPERIAVTGRSYGGYLTMTGLTRYPDRWVAGSAVVPFLNWFTGHANSRKDLQHWDLENFGDPVVDRDLYYRRSPFFFLDRVSAPVQLICGAHDPRCPASESVQARDALLAHGKPCELALYPDEGHSFLKTGNLVDAETRRVAFLAAALEREE